MTPSSHASFKILLGATASPSCLPQYTRSQGATPTMSWQHMTQVDPPATSASVSIAITTTATGTIGSTLPRPLFVRTLLPRTTCHARRFYEECLSTLQFANRCRSVHNNPRVNKLDVAAAADPRKIRKLQDEIAALRRARRNRRLIAFGARVAAQVPCHRILPRYFESIFVYCKKEKCVVYQ